MKKGLRNVLDLQYLIRYYSTEDVMHDTFVKCSLTGTLMAMLIKRYFHIPSVLAWNVAKRVMTMIL